MVFQWWDNAFIGVLGRTVIGKGHVKDLTPSRIDYLEGRDILLQRIPFARR